jgi:hypothetical protein
MRRSFRGVEPQGDGERQQQLTRAAFFDRSALINGARKKGEKKGNKTSFYDTFTAG